MELILNVMGLLTTVASLHCVICRKLITLFLTALALIDQNENLNTIHINVQMHY